jgi:hypothetical protein
MQIEKKTKQMRTEKKRKTNATESKQQPELGRRHEPRGWSENQPEVAAAATHHYSPLVSHEGGGRASNERKNSSGEWQS